ncbi:MAG: hypothetical protein JW969_20505 [Spirochaetales bacterium]|nr:hypothetical protein [Spirochaetales bacterium]
MDNLKKNIDRIREYLEKIGSQLSRIDKYPDSEEDARIIIDSSIREIRKITVMVLENRKNLKPALKKTLKRIMEKDPFLYWWELSEALQKAMPHEPRRNPVKRDAIEILYNSFHGLTFEEWCEKLQEQYKSTDRDKISQIITFLVNNHHKVQYIMDEKRGKIYVHLDLLL